MKQHFKERYGNWAGNPAGYKPDFDRCCHEVHSNFQFHQCNRKNGHGPDGAYCKQHDPAAVEARRAASQAKYEADSIARQRRGYRGADDVLRKIAEGHNDPRSIAQEWLDKFT